MTTQQGGRGGITTCSAGGALALRSGGLGGFGLGGAPDGFEPLRTDLPRMRA